ncbi:hypothetical protein DBR32_10965 [Taibaiella sp. KBW10]|uniref:T9SS type A sorting domain-containing protein n=1 Tax=Taibaiella sp. KBW10 TaxID=2153357 RepID=UPI000F5A76EC|nr:T9SS type A sorting domain-containing protein [Taibaiella sp. KBW10]RQO30099.1 hypothetical protein DBR32_10965 [Taibaiella sp. KBW10]
MQKISVLLLCLLFTALFPLNLMAQQQEFDWNVQHSARRTQGSFDIRHIRTDKQGNIYSFGLFADSMLVGGVSPQLLIRGEQLTSGSGQYEFVITKMDKDSNLVWMKKFDKKIYKLNHVYNAPGAAGMVIDDSANIYVAGSFPGTIDVDPGAGTHLLEAKDNTLVIAKDAFVVKLNKEGELEWAKHMTKNVTPFVSIYNRAADINLNNLEMDKNGKLYVSGFVMEAQAGDSLVFDPTGANYLKTFSNTVPRNPGMWFRLDKEDGSLEKMQFTKGNNIGNMMRFKMIPDNDGHIYATGYISDTFDLSFDNNTPYMVHPLNIGSLAYNSFVARYDTNGTALWAHVFESKRSIASDVQVDTNRNVVVIGSFQDSIRIHDNGIYTNSYIQSSGAYVAKYNQSGNLVWENVVNLNQPTDLTYDPAKLTLDAFGNVYVSGTVEGRFNAAGVTFQTYTHAFVRKYKSAGAIDWTMRFGSVSPLISSERLNANVVYVDASNNLYTAGMFRTNPFNIDPLSTAGHIVAPSRSINYFAAKYTCVDTSTTNLTISACNEYVLDGVTYTQSGQYYRHYWSAGGCDSVVNLDLTVNNILEPFITVNNFELGVTSAYQSYQWLLNDTVIIGATQSTYTVSRNGNYKVVVTTPEGCSDTSEVYAVTNVTSLKDVYGVATQIKIYPNPAVDMLYIESPVAVQTVLTSVEGRVMIHTKNQKKVNLATVVPGIYFLKILDKEGGLIKVEKVIKK